MGVSLSVALCTFNGASFIGEQLYSILSQRLPVQEIVICDDGSSDETLDIIGSFSKKYPEIKWQIHKNTERRGVTKNYEQALSLCQGDIVFLADQDDIWLPEKTERIVEFLSQHPRTNLVFTDAILIDETGKELSSKTLYDVCGFRKLIPLWDAGLQFEIENVVQRLLGATMALRRDFLSRCLPFHPEVQNYHDGQLAMQSVVDNCNGHFDECLIRYRIHSHNVVGLGGNAGGRLTQETQDPRSVLVEPRGINPYFLLPCAAPLAPRVRFFIKRTTHYASFFGKLLLASSIVGYMKYYRRFWVPFYASDLLYGASERLRKKMVYRIRLL